MTTDSMISDRSSHMTSQMPVLDLTGWASTAQMADQLGIGKATLTRYRAAQLRGPRDRAYRMVSDMPSPTIVFDTRIMAWPVREMLVWNALRERHGRSAGQRGADGGC